MSVKWLSITQQRIFFNVQWLKKKGICNIQYKAMDVCTNEENNIDTYRIVTYKYDLRINFDM